MELLGALWCVSMGGFVFLYVVQFIKWFTEPLAAADKDRNPYKPYWYSRASRKKELFPNTIDSRPTKTVTIVIPAYNEENRIQLSLDPTIKYLQNRQSSNDPNNDRFSWEIIVVSDGSTDKTCEIVQNNYVTKYGSDLIRLLSYSQNEGKGFAVQQGMLHARGCLILFADADGASEITHMQRLENDLFQKLSTTHSHISNNANPFRWHHIPGIAVGSRKDLQHKAEAERTLLRNVLMWGFHACVKYIGGVKGVKDTQCGFKLFTRNAVRNIFLYQKIRRWCFDLELIFIGQLQNIPIVETAIRWQEIEGSKLSVMYATFSMLREMILIRLCYITGKWYKDVPRP